MEGGPWSCDKHLLILQEAVGMERVSEINFWYVPFWIQLHNLPIACLNRDVGVYLGGMVGQVKEIDAGEYGNYKGHLVGECPKNGGGLIDKAKLRFGGWMRATLPKRARFFCGNKAGGLFPSGSRIWGISTEAGRVLKRTIVDMGNTGVNVEVEDGIAHDSVKVMKPSRNCFGSIENTIKISDSVVSETTNNNDPIIKENCGMDKGKAVANYSNVEKPTSIQMNTVK
ncbi:hypothetical protein LWI28_010278 [Acer negundo]|uniref:DUF4283 domain-containing protein n=1 Tax=Acer negundo TaxID=4023 RepID=A0AAD5NN36_ACENE|nr:hypothetical protein LWI28_010278 [Acer negundo]